MMYKPQAGLSEHLGMNGFLILAAACGSTLAVHSLGIMQEKEARGETIPERWSSQDSAQIKDDLLRLGYQAAYKEAAGEDDRRQIDRTTIEVQICYQSGCRVATFVHYCAPGNGEVRNQKKFRLQYKAGSVEIEFHPEDDRTVWDMIQTSGIKRVIPHWVKYQFPLPPEIA